MKGAQRRLVAASNLEHELFQRVGDALVARGMRFAQHDAGDGADVDVARADGELRQVPGHRLSKVVQGGSAVGSQRPMELGRAA